MNVLMLTSEALPFYKTGGLGDMVSSLSKALIGEGDDARIFLPLYNEDNIDFKVQYIGETYIEFPYGKEKVGFAKAEDGPVTYYFLLHPIFSKRSGVYGDKKGSYDDTLKRQVLFTKSIEGLIYYSRFKPDVLHSHDWFCGLVPYYYKNKYKTVFTIHNIAYQGKSNAFESVPLGFPLDESTTEIDNNIKVLNSLKCAILNADKITTVSPSYAKEILTPRFSEGLDSYLKMRESDTFGILNGVDENVWNPTKDKFLEKNTYSIKDMSGKKKIRANVLQEFGFDKKDKRPLIAIISRLAVQKGFYEATNGGTNSAIERLLKEKRCLFACIGTGDSELENRFNYYDRTYDTFSFKNIFSEKLSHTLEAGADFFFMPSVYEPCGLNQMYSLMYATPPIVNNVGGLKDTVVDISKGAKANGFILDNLTSDCIKNKVDEAIVCYNNNKDIYKKMQQNGAKKDFSWKSGALNYQSVYKGCKNTKEARV